MNSERNVPIMEDMDFNNERHRPESIANLPIENAYQLKQGKEYEENNSAMHYVGNKARSIKSRFLSVTLELVMLLYMFSYVMRYNTATVMIMDKVCIVHLGYSEDTCHNLKDYPDVKSEVEKMANNYQLGQTLLQLMPSALLALFIGSWSDKYGRKFPIICAQIGIILDGLGTTLCSYYFYSRVEYYFIPSVFTGLSGGFIVVLMTLYSFVSDVSTPGRRTLKYAFMELASGLAAPLGGLAGGWIFKFYSFAPVFLISTCGHMLSLCCVIFFLKETRGLDNNDNWSTKFRNFWSLDAMKNSFRTTLKKRPNSGRKQIWLLILAMGITIFNATSLSGIAYIYVHHMFNWDNTTFSTVAAIYSVIYIIAMMIIVPLSQIKSISDPVLGIIGSVSLLLKNVGTGLSFEKWIYHLAYFSGLLSVLGCFAGRSRLSKVVPKDDLGKVFAFLSSAETIFPIVATAIVSQVFNATLDIFPGLIYVVMGVFVIMPLSVFIWIYRLPAIECKERDEGASQEEIKVEEDEKVEELESAKN